MTFDPSSLPIREDLVQAHRYIWEQFAAPGTWWSGIERVAIMAHARCARDDEGIPDTYMDVLPAQAIEAINRISADLHHIDKEWFDDLVDIGSTDGHYVEIVSICSILAGIDRFYSVMGLDLLPLPEPVAGSPSGYRPTVAESSENAWVPTISPLSALDGPEADIYQGAKATAMVIIAQSLVPDAVRLLSVYQAAHYMGEIEGFLPMGEVDRAISRAQIEYIAGRVSAHNQCFYWLIGHAGILRGRSKDTGVNYDLRGYDNDAIDIGVEYETLLKELIFSALNGEHERLKTVREQIYQEMGSEALVDAMAVMASFECMNRIADACGIAVESRMLDRASGIIDELGIRYYNSAKNSPGAYQARN